MRQVFAKRTLSTKLTYKQSHRGTQQLSLLRNETSSRCCYCDFTVSSLIQRNQRNIGSRAVNTSSVRKFSTAKDSAEIVESFFGYRSTERHPLDKIFKPQTVAVIGASEKQGSVGRTLLWNLMSNPFGGTIFPVNPKRKNVMGIMAYPDVKSIPQKVDLAVICIPAHQVPAAIQECVDVGIEGAVVITAGFTEAGEEGKKWAAEMLEIARKGKMRLIGPNCLGVMSPSLGFNCTFAATIALPGKVAVISQSGALGTAILDWSLQERVGFSAFMSIGSMVDVQWGDLLEYLGRDPSTEAIVLYMESIGNARSFISAARNVAMTKPIIVIKVGRTEEGGRAAASHTGTLTGSDDVLDTAFKRCGVLRVDTIAELFYMAQVLAKQPRPQGNRLAIITNAGGPAALSTDALVRYGGELAKVSPQSIEKLNKILPPHWSHGNPVDVLGDAPPERYAQTLDVITGDSQIDGMLVILTPQAMSDPTRTAEVLRDYVNDNDMGSKPVLASWMGGAIVEGGRKVLTDAGIPNFNFPDVACKVFNYMYKYSKNVESLYEIDEDAELETEPVPAKNRTEARVFLKKIREEGRTLLTEYESKHILNLYLIPTTKMILAKTVDEAVAAANEIGYPVVLKIHSHTIVHKMDVGGVRLNLKEEKYVREAFETMQKNNTEGFIGVTVQPMVRLSDSYEVIFGANTDQQCGPVLLFGAGGSYVELFKDTALGLPPLTRSLAKNMITSTKIYNGLKGFRGKKPVDMNEMVRLLLRFSQLVTDLNLLVKEIDINPLVCSHDRIIALDARILIYDQSVSKESVPKPAIRAYPYFYVTTHTLKLGSNDEPTNIIIRPARPEDHLKMLRFYGELSNKAMELSESEVALKYIKAFSKIHSLSDECNYDRMRLFKEAKVVYDALVRMCIGDYDNEIVLVAERESDRKVIAVADYTKSTYTPGKAYMSVIVSDESRGKGLGELCVRTLTSIAQREGIKELVGEITVHNQTMQNLCKKLGFDMKPSMGYQGSKPIKVIRAIKSLQ
jgi:acetyltransferase